MIRKMVSEYAKAEEKFAKLTSDIVEEIENAVAQCFPYNKCVAKLMAIDPFPYILISFTERVDLLIKYDIHPDLEAEWITCPEDIENFCRLIQKMGLDVYAMWYCNGMMHLSVVDIEAKEPEPLPPTSDSD